MNAVVSIRFRYLPGEYVRAINAHQRTRMRLALDVAVSATVLAVGLLVLTVGGRGDVWLGVTCVTIGLAFPLVLAFLYFILPRVLTSARPPFDSEYQLTFSDGGIHFRTTAVDSRLEWSLYRRAVVLRDFYLLYYIRGFRQFTAIPKRAFESESDRAAFEALLCTHVPKIWWKA
jgi:hypothetical protein